MPKHAAVKLQVHVGRDHMVKLPDDVPEGPAEIVVLVADGNEGGLPVLGLFSDQPDLIDAVCAAAMQARERDPLRRA